MSNIGNNDKTAKTLPLDQKLMALKPKRANPMEQLTKASQMYEKHFLNEMVKAMRSSVAKGGLVEESMGDRIYTQELDQEYVKSWVGRGGVGLAKIIENQMLQQFGIKPQAPTPSGPQSGMYKINQLPNQNPKKMELQIEATDPQTSLSLPWSGKVSTWQQSPGGLNGHLMLDHGNFDSVWSLPRKPKLEVGQDLASGSLLLNTVPSKAIRLEIRAKA